MTKDYTLPTEEWDIPIKPTCSECGSDDLHIELAGGITIRCNECGYSTTGVALNIRK